MKYRAKLNGIVVCMLLAVLLAACGATATPAAPANTPAPVATAPAALPTTNLNAPTTAAAQATTAAATTAATNATTAASGTTAAAGTPAAGATAAAGTPKKGGALVTSVTSDVKTLHLYKRASSLSFEYLAYIFNAPPVRRDPKTLAVTGLAAKSWEFNKETATVTFKLREDMKWSDGKPLTANDYVWTWNQAIKKENGWDVAASAVFDPANPDPNAVKEYTAPDPYTLRIVMGGATFSAVETASGFIEPLPQHIWEGKDWNDPTKNPEINAPTVGSGSWKLKEWIPNNRFVVVRNDNSTILPPPFVDSLTYTVVPNASVAYQKLKNGEIDFYKPAEQDVAEVEGISSLTTYKWQQAQNSFDYVGVNLRKPYLQDLKLRQALIYAFDRKGLIEKVVYNLGVPIYSSVPPVSSYYNDTVEKYPYDPEKSKKILTDAGYKIDGGKLIDPKGQPIPKVKMLHSAPNAVREKTSAVLQEEWKKLGVEMEIITGPNASIIETLQKEPYDFDFWIGNWSLGYNPETFANDIWNAGPSANRGVYKNEELFKLYSQAVQEFDAAKRKEIMSKIQVIESNDLPYFFYYARLNWITVNKKVGGVVASPIGFGYNNLIDWYIK